MTNFHQSKLAMEVAIDGTLVKNEISKKFIIDFKKIFDT